MTELENNNDMSWMPPYMPALYRYLICAGLSGYSDLLSEYLELSAEGQQTNDASYMTQNILKLMDSPKKCDLFCGDDRETFGLLMPLAAALGKSCIFRVSENLMDESMFNALKTLKVHGIRHELISRSSMRIWGRLTTGTYIIPSDLDPSFLSGLLMALPLLKEKSMIMIDGPFIPELHVNLTLKALEKSEIKIDFEINKDQAGAARGAFIGASFKINGGQKYLMDMHIPAGANWPYE